MKKVVLFIYVLISIYSCNTQKKENDLDKAGLKGDVVMISETYQYDKYDPILHISQFENGFLIREYGNQNEYLKIYHYKNDYLERIYTDKFEDGKIRQDVEVFDYDSNKNLIKKTSVINGASWNYEYYFSNNKLQKESVSSGIVKSITNYYYSEFLDSTYTESKNLLQIFNKVYYNSLGQSIKSIITYMDGEEVTIIKEYNEKGDIIKSISSKTSGGSDKETDEIEYVYDGNGNWTSKISKYHDGRMSKSTREIYYKGDDFNKVSKILDEVSSRILVGDSHAQPEEYSGSNKVQSPENDSQSEGSNAQEVNTSQKRECYDCEGTGQCPKCSKPQRVRYKQGESPNDHNEIRLGLIVCTQCGGNLMNFGADKNKSCYLCKASGWLYCPECNSSGNGSYIGKCKRCKGTGFDR